MLKDKIKLFILDDHQMLIDGLKSLLETEKAFEFIGSAQNGVQALVLISKNVPDIVLSDINMPIMNGIDFTKELKKRHPNVKVIALSMFNEKGPVSEMLSAGASGYILKKTGKEELLSALQKVAAGGSFLSDEVAVELVKSIHQPADNNLQNNPINITKREKEIIQLIAKEYSNAQIAEQLFISERTVETHRKNIFHKLNVKSVVGLVKYAIENKLID